MSVIKYWRQYIPSPPKILNALNPGTLELAPSLATPQRLAQSTTSERKPSPCLHAQPTQLHASRQDNQPQTGIDLSFCQKHFNITTHPVFKGKGFPPPVKSAIYTQSARHNHKSGKYSADHAKTFSRLSVFLLCVQLFAVDNVMLA